MTESKGMVDISGKKITIRTAKAIGTVILGNQAFKVLKEGTSKKGDVIATAKIAAINAAKGASALIPMCHPILIEAIDVEFKLNNKNKSVSVIISVKSSGKTGVEMEALCGVAAACLTIYDMLKYITKSMTITGINVIEKTGGKSGDYKRKN